MKSGLTVYSIGIVSDGYDMDKLKDVSTREQELNKLIEIYPVEHISDIDGDIEKIDKIKHKTKDIDGNNVLSKLDKKKTLSCRWIPISNFNKTTPPTIAKGMTVRVFRYLDTDTYYWDTIYTENDLKLGEYLEDTYVTESGSIYTKVIDTLNNIFSLLSPPDLEHIYKVFFDIDNDEYGLTIDSNGIVFYDGGKVLRINTLDMLNISNTNTLITSSKDVTIETPMVNMTDKLKVSTEINVNSVDVYKMLTDHEKRISKLETYH